MRVLLFLSVPVSENNDIGQLLLDVALLLPNYDPVKNRGRKE
jgi:hypothetical protein